MMTQLMAGLALAIMGIGLWGLITRRNFLRIILGFSLLDTGTHLLLVAIGFRKDGTAPIVDGDLSIGELATQGVDPIPSALVLTAIVIGLAVTALMLSFGVRMYQRRRTLNIDEIKELKW